MNTIQISQSFSSPIDASQYTDDHQCKSTAITEIFPTSFLTAAKDLKNRVIKKIDNCEAKLDALLPNFFMQNQFDKFLQLINSFQSGVFQGFHEWLLSTGNGAWYHQLAVYLTKLPIHIAYNVVHHLFSLIKVIITVPLQAAMHPMKIPLNIAKLLVELVHALSQPETWSKIGIGLMGSSMANSMITSNPIGTVAFGIGAALTFAGISVGTLKTALLAEENNRFEKITHYLFDEAKHLLVDMLTGFCMVSILEGIQQAMRGIQRTFQRVSRYLEHEREIRVSQASFVHEQATEFMSQHRLPYCDHLDYHGGLSYFCGWRIDRGQHFFENFPKHLNLSVKDVITGYNTRYESQLMPGYYENGVWKENYYETVYISEPIYERCAGYDLYAMGWQEPALPSLPPAITIHREAYPMLGTTPSIGDFVFNTSKGSKSKKEKNT